MANDKKPSFLRQFEKFKSMGKEGKSTVKEFVDDAKYMIKHRKEADMDKITFKKDWILPILAFMVITALIFEALFS